MEAQLGAAGAFLSETEVAACVSAVRGSSIPAARYWFVTASRAGEAAWYAAGALAIFESKSLERVTLTTPPPFHRRQGEG